MNSEIASARNAHAPKIASLVARTTLKLPVTTSEAQKRVSLSVAHRSGQESVAASLPRSTMHSTKENGPETHGFGERVFQFYCRLRDAWL